MPSPLRGSIKEAASPSSIQPAPPTVRRASDATEKIYGKIQQIEEESFTKKVQAIKAWKQGALSRLYLEIGSQSMEQKIPVNEVIAARQAAGQETLTDVEFEAIADLNRRLRY